jgi:hypothetical protein
MVLSPGRLAPGELGELGMAMIFEITPQGGLRGSIARLGRDWIPQSFPGLPEACPLERRVMHHLLAQLLHLNPTSLLP